jgi:NTE family protein
MTEATGFTERWPARPAPWVVAVDYDRGRRTVFRAGQATRSRLAPPRSAGWGNARRRGSSAVPALPYGAQPPPAVSLADAVVASCSIPGWYPPVVINGRPYIDGGAASNASVDLLAGLGLDEVYVLAPMASTRPDSPRTAVARVERMVRRAVTRHILGDAARLEAEGTRVTVLTPGPEDLEVIGVNLMDPSRRTAVLDTAVRTTAAELRGQRVRAAS